VSNFNGSWFIKSNNSESIIALLKFSKLKLSLSKTILFFIVSSNKKIFWGTYPIMLCQDLMSLQIDDQEEFTLKSGPILNRNEPGI
jgi:hypothetical protein